MASILVVAAHSDDEALGAGGTIARYAAAGDSVQVVFVADGETSRSSGADVARREQAAGAAAKILGCKPPHFLKLPDQRLDTLPLLDIVQRIEAVVKDVSPTAVYTHHPGDLNADHRIVVQAVLTACRPVPGTSVREIYGFEVPSSTEWSGGAAVQFAPTRFVDISATLPRKLEALECYAAEMRPFPHPRSAEAVRALATWRGATAGYTAAEAFSVLRQIVGR